MQHKGLAAILVAGALTLMAGGAYAGSNVSAEESSTVAVPLPPSSPATIAVTINDERHEIQRGGAKNHTLYVEVDGATRAQLDSVQSADCEGFNVERHMSARLGPSEGDITIRREYTPVKPGGTVGEPREETIVSYSAPDQPANVAVDVCA